MTPSRRRFLLAAVAAAAAGFFLLAFGLFPQEPVRLYLETRLREMVGPGAQIGSLRLWPGRLRGEMGNLVLEGPSYRVVVPRARFALRASTLLGGPLAFESLELEDAKVLVRATSPAPESGQAWAGPVSIERLRVSGLDVEYQGTPEQGVVTLEDLGVQGSVGGGELALTLPRLSWTRNTATIISIGATGRLQVGSDLALRLPELVARSEHSQVRVSGDLGRLGALVPALEFEATVDTAEVAAIANLLSPQAAVRAGGVVTARGKVQEQGKVLAAEATLGSPHLDLLGWPLDATEARVRWRSDGSSEATVTARVFGGSIEGQGRVQQERAQLDARFEDIDVARLRRQVEVDAPLTGTVSGRLQAQGPARGPLAVEAHARSEGRAEEARLASTADARGTIHLDPLRLDLDWTAHVQGADAGALADFDLEATGRAEGAAPPSLSARLTGRASLRTARGTVPAELTGDVRMRERTVEASFEARAQQARVQGRLEAVGGEPRRLELSATDVDLAQWVEGARGRVHVAFAGSGAPERLTGQGELTARGLGWRDVELGDARGALETGGGSAQVTAEVPALAASAAFSVPLKNTRQGAAAGTFRLAGAPLAPFSPLLPEGAPLAGELTADGEFRLPLADPAAGMVKLAGRTFRASRGRLAVEAAAPFSVALDDRRLTLAGLDLRGRGFQLAAEGSAGLEAKAPLDVRLRGHLDLAQLEAPEGTTLAGRADGEVILSGTRQAPRADGRVALSEIEVAVPKAPPARVATGEIVLAGDALSVSDLRASVADGQVALSAAVPFAALTDEHSAAPARASVRWSGLQAARFVERLRAASGQPPAAPLEATLQGELTLEGPPRDRRALRAELRLPATPVRVGETTIDVAPVAGHLAAGTATIDPFELTGAQGTLRLGGSLGLEDRALRASADGTLDLSALSPFLEDTAATGEATVQAALSGTLDRPRADGSVVLREGTLRVRDIPEALTDIAARIELAGEEVRIAEGRAAIGGGTLTAAGTARLAAGGVEDVDVALSGRQMALRYPEGLKTRVDADLTLRGKTGALTLAGKVTAERGLYDRDLDQAMMAAVVPPSTSPLLRSVGLQIEVETENPVLVRNDLAELQARAQLTLRGDLAEPAPFGRAEITRGGKVTLRDNQFEVQQGTISYRGTWDPELDITAKSRITTKDYANYDVTVHVTGAMERPVLTFTSQPGLEERQIVNLLMTGTIAGDAVAGGALALGEQAAALVGGKLSRGLSKRLRGLGLDQVTIQPELLAREEEPGARFTFAKELGQRFSLLYSLSLRDPEDRFLQVEARAPRDVTLFAQRRDDGLFSPGLRQRFRFGGARRGGSADVADDRVAVGAVRLEGGLPLPEAELRSALGTEPGDRVSVWQVQDDADRLRERLRRAGYLEAEVTAHLTSAEGPARDAVFRVRSGPRYAWRVEGLGTTPDLTSEVQQALFEEEALEKGRTRLLRDLISRGHLEARVATRVDRVDAGTRTLVFKVEPGPRLEQGALEFPGASALTPGELRRAAGGVPGLLQDPARAVAGIRDAYRARFFLAARVGPVERRREGRRLSLAVPVVEGEPARITAVTFPGATRPPTELAGLTRLVPGIPYSETAALEAQTRLQAHYFGLGHAGARVRPRVVPEGTGLAVAFDVHEGTRATVGRVEIRGLRHTRESLVRGQIDLQPGDVLDPRRLTSLERRISELGAFTSVSATATADEPATILVQVVEGERLVAGYDARWNEEEKLSASVDGELRNLLGRGVSAGGRHRRASDLTETRLFTHVPAVLRGGDLTLTVFELEEDLSTGDLEILRTQRGFSVQHEMRLGRLWQVLAGYRLRRSLTAFGASLTASPTYIAGLDLSLLRDSRDDLLDPRRGRFFTVNFELSPKALKSDLDFLKAYAQLFDVRSFRKESLTWAQGLRVGWAHVLDQQPLLASEGFTAGGANTVRGYAFEGAGGGGITGQQAVLVLNEELRYRHSSGLGGVVFYDAGRAFDTSRDLGLDLRHALGLGLRWDSPVGLLRFDVGFPLDREDEERKYQLWLSLGQAF